MVETFVSGMAASAALLILGFVIVCHITHKREAKERDKKYVSGRLSDLNTKYFDLHWRIEDLEKAAKKKARRK